MTLPKPQKPIKTEDKNPDATKNQDWYHKNDDRSCNSTQLVNIFVGKVEGWTANHLQTSFFKASFTYCQKLSSISIRFLISM